MNEEEMTVYWQGRPYYKINRFDCHIVDLQTHPSGGRYFTVLPISPIDYRRKNPTGASVKVERGIADTVFLICGDGGERLGVYEMVISNQYTDEIDTAIQAAKDNELLDD